MPLRSHVARLRPAPRSGDPSHRWTGLFLAAAALLTSSCSIHFEDLDALRSLTRKDSAGQTLLSEVETDDGRTTTYSLSQPSRSFPTGAGSMEAGILISTDKMLDVPYLGLDASSVNTWIAEEHGLEPWRGVFVTKVEEDSAAALAALERGDLILSLNGEDVGSREQFAGLVTDTLIPGEEATLEVSRPLTEFTRDAATVTLVVGSRAIEETESDRVNLAMNRDVALQTGLGVATIPSDLADEIYGIERPTPLVTAVVTGSPAYMAGIRAGDRLLQVNGQPVDTASDLRQHLNRGDRQLDVVVEGPLGSHGASFEVKDDVMVKSDFHIPIIVDHEERVDRKSLSVLEFIFLFGFTKDVRYYQSDTRRVKKSKSVSILPLGMFEFTRTPTKRTNRIFWFIRWSSKV